METWSLITGAILLGFGSVLTFALSLWSESAREKRERRNNLWEKQNEELGDVRKRARELASKANDYNFLDLHSYGEFHRAIRQVCDQSYGTAIWDPLTALVQYCSIRMSVKNREESFEEMKTNERKVIEALRTLEKTIEAELRR